VLWSQSYAGNSSYLSSASNGLGLSESFAWTLARNNFHGVVSGSIADPFACNSSSVQATYPCNMPDDGSWSRAVLTQRTDSVVRLTQAGQGGTQTSTAVSSTWNYSYLVPYPIQAPDCTLCVATFYCVNQNDFDLLDFYNGRFMGFAQANVSLPDGSLQVHKFLTTEGFGVYDTSEVSCDPVNHNTTCTAHNDSWADLGNAAHGHEFELDRYDTNGTTLLQQVKTRWAAACPPPGVGSTPASSNFGNWDGGLVTELDHSNPVMVCEVHPLQTDTLTYDGATSGPVPDRMTTYSYDGLGRVSSQRTIDTTGVFDLSGHGDHAVWTGGVGFGVPRLVAGNSDRAMSFDGSSGAVVTPLTDASWSQLTVEGWFQLSSLPGGAHPRVVANAHTDVDLEGFQMELDPSSNAGFVDVGTASGGEVRASWTQTLSAGTPYHYVLTYDGATLSAYLNGALVASTTKSGAGPVLASALPVMVGRDPAYSSDFFPGTLDEVAVYGTALSSSRVQAHFGAGSGYQSAVLADAPTAYYRLDDGAVGTNPGPTTIVSRPAYVQNDSVSATSTSAAGPYLIDYPAFDDVEDTSGNRYRCSYTSYDGQPFTTGQTGGLTLGEATAQARYTGCGTSPSFTPSGQIQTTSAYDVLGNLVARSDADANAGVAGHTGCTVGSTAHSACSTFDGTFGTLPTASANALDQTATTGYQPAGATAPAVVQDSGGQGYNATPGSAVTFGAPGLVSGDPDPAATFNGSSGSTVNLDLPSLDTTSGHQVTVEFWMKYGGSGGMPFGFNRYDLLIDSSGFGFNTAVSDNYGVPLSSLPTNTPVHVVAVFGNSSLTANKLYINGVAQTLNQLHGTPQSQSVTRIANISGWGRDGNNRFNGTLGKVAIYNGALSASRVQAHFSAGAAYNAAVLADSPIAFYRLNDTAGSGGFGLWPTSTTDANGNTTGVTHDALGRETSETRPVTAIADSSGHGLNGVPTGAIG
jgi:YD repeat-containing protein